MTDHAKNLGGRPGKLTDELLKELEKVVDSQWSVQDACIKVGIHSATWHRWKAAGLEDLKDGKDDTPAARFCAIASRVGVSRREKAQGVLQQVIENPKAKDADRVQAAGTILRLDQTKRVELSGPDGGAVEVKHSVDAWGESIRRMIENDGKV